MTPRDMTPGQINKALDKLRAKQSKLTDKFIDAGRGNETTWTTLAIKDPSDALAAEFQALSNAAFELRCEIDRRYGPGAPSRLPTRR